MPARYRGCKRNRSWSNAVEYKHLLVFLRQYVAPVRYLMQQVSHSSFGRSSERAVSSGRSRPAVDDRSSGLPLQTVANAQLIALIKQIHQPVAGSSTGIHQRIMPCLSNIFSVTRCSSSARARRRTAVCVQRTYHHAEIAGFNQKLTVLNIAFRSPSSEDACTSASVESTICLHFRRVILPSPASRQLWLPGAAAYRFTKINHVCAAGGGLLKKSSSVSFGQYHSTGPKEYFLLFSLPFTVIRAKGSLRAFGIDPSVSIHALCGTKFCGSAYNGR